MTSSGTQLRASCCCCCGGGGGSLASPAVSCCSSRGMSVIHARVMASGVAWAVESKFPKVDESL